MGKDPDPIIDPQSNVAKGMQTLGISPQMLNQWLSSIGEEEVQAPVAKAPAKVALVGPHKDIRDATTKGDLATQLQNAEFLKKVNAWMETADPGDPEQKSDMVAVIKAMDPEKREMRQKAFELTFKTKLQSEERNYTPMMVTDQKTKQKVPKIDPKTKLPMFFEGKPKSIALDPKALTAMVEIMEQFPLEHMPKGWVLEGQDKPTDKSTHGSYDDRTDLAALTFSLNDVAEGGKFTYAVNCLPDDPLYEAKAFDLLVRHECGHKAGLSLGSRSLTSKPEAGGWIDHGNIDGLLGALATEFNDLVKAIQVKDAPPVEKIRKAVKNPDNSFDASAIAEELGLPEDRVPAENLLLKVLQQGGMPNAWNLRSAPVSIKDRMYLVGGPENNWFSFSKATWEKRVSFYQYATPEEWFAEFYATANNKDAKVREAAKTRYPDAWKWLKDNKCLVFEAK